MTRVLILGPDGRVTGVTDTKKLECTHNTMVPNDDPERVWKCADCGYVYGKDGESNERT